MAAAAVPAAIGVGSSIIGGIQGKGAAKRQEKLAREMLDAQRPLMDAQRRGLEFALSQGQQLFPMATNAINTVFNQATGQFEPMLKDYRQMLADATSSQSKFNAEGDQLMGFGNEMLRKSFAEQLGAMTGLADLEQAYRPFMQDGARAIEKFLPSQATLQKLMAGDFANVNQGFKSASENIANFAPRGGGRVSTLANADVQRQRDLTSLGAQGRKDFGQMALNNFFQGAEGTRGALGTRAQIAGDIGQRGLGTIGAGQQSKQLGIQEFGSKANVGLQQLQSALQALGLAGGAAGNLGQLAQGTLGLGTEGGGNLYNMLNKQMDRAFGAGPQQGVGAEGLGSQLVKMFSSPGAQDWLGGLFKGGKGPSTMPNSKVPS